MTQDVLADVFQIMRVSGADYSRFEAAAPWAIRVRSADVVRFYAVLSGDCMLSADGLEPIRLSPGDLVVLPQGAAHTLASDVGAELSLPEAALDRAGIPHFSIAAASPAPRGTGSRCSLISGRFRFEPPHEQQWWPLLPPLIAARGRAHTLPWLESTLHFIASESDLSKPGSATLVTRITDLLVFQVVREYLAGAERQAHSGPGWLNALVEPHIGAALALLHQNPERAWTVAGLARRVGMSRSAFAARFTRLVGEPPLHYLTRLRMQKAAALLRDSASATAEIADQVGYVSDTAFCKAFKREFGQSPGAYRRWVKTLAEPEAA